MKSSFSRAVDTVRVVAAETVQKANSGHPGAPMGCAPIATALYANVMNYCPKGHKWINRDRFVLSNGHASALLYTMLHNIGILSVEDLQGFRQLNSRTPGHPEFGHTPGVEVTTGPLGQGLSNAVGMAIAAKHAGAEFNRPGFDVINPTIYVLAGDGCLMEGVTNEASSIAGHMKLDNLVVLYDDNHITIDGSTDVAFTEDAAKRYEALGWHVIVVENGDDSEATDVLAAIEQAKTIDRPVLIKVRTTIGIYSAKAGTSKVHGSPIGAEDCARVRKELGIEGEAFETPADVKQFWADVVESKRAGHKAWGEMLERYAVEFPELHADLARRIKGEAPAELDAALKAVALGDAKATRQANNAILNVVNGVTPEVVGGSADLCASNLTTLKKNGEYMVAGDFSGRSIPFGVREHAMAALTNGISAFGLHWPFCATFMVFSGYMLGAMRVSAISGHRVVYVLTHDSIGVGEDGPTHQPVETLGQLRAIPNLSVWRPADERETAAAYAVAATRAGPLALALSRQGVPALCPDVELAMKGGYVLMEEANPQLILVASGTETSLAHDAAEAMIAKGIRVRVVSMPSVDAFNAQPTEYQEEVLPRRTGGVPIVSVEAASAMGMAGVSHAHIGVEEFGRSAPASQVYKVFGLTPEGVSERAAKFVGRTVGPILFE
ncbi:Transketolase bacterial-like [Carpediemonas membranifera]|uniref:Transketolase n=1 Tax=Carpediemonas membranifera TaxID=201153 RepID=A0A8J6DZ92_9EUKA|nr:Transketolase bacterial-like [Carpediemonas membranifera]|eukprot:KAG9390116.1 Transketolase bacterial-like [Carpediemonas membranifera]